MAVLRLASNSPRRRQLLALTGWAFNVRPVDIDETPRPGEAPGDYVLRLAESKARAAAQLAQPGQVVLTFLLAAMAGIGISVGYLVPWSMVPDVVELDELQTGQRREGVFYGFFVFLQKMGLALGLFISGWVLDLSGYIGSTPGAPDPIQPASALLALRVLIGPVSCDYGWW